MFQKVSPTWFKYNQLFPGGGNLAAVNGMNLNTMNGLSTLSNMAAYSNGVNNLNNIAVNAYQAGMNSMNGIATFNAINGVPMVNGNNVSNVSGMQGINGQGLSAFPTPSYETERAMVQNGLNNIGNNNDFNWPNNFVIADSNSYSQAMAITQANNANLTAANSFNMNLNFPAMQKNLLQGMTVASSSPTSSSSVYATISSLPQQSMAFTVQNPIGNGLQAMQFQRPDQLAMKMMAPSILTVRNSQVPPGN